ncbi:hypothetical protein Tco_0286446 [Tanacetum coccineum]
MVMTMEMVMEMDDGNGKNHEVTYRRRAIRDTPIVKGKSSVGWLPREWTSPGLMEVSPTTKRRLVSNSWETTAEAYLPPHNRQNTGGLTESLLLPMCTVVSHRVYIGEKKKYRRVGHLPRELQGYKSYYPTQRGQVKRIRECDLLSLVWSNKDITGL